MIGAIIDAMMLAGDPLFDFATNMGVGRSWFLMDDQVNKLACGCGCDSD